MKSLTLFLAATTLLASPLRAAPVYSVTDVSHAYTFYFDGRFAREYYDAESRDARNWGVLSKCDLRDANLLVLPAGATPIPYRAKDMSAVRFFLESGGGVLVLGDYDAFPGEYEYHINTLLDPFGAEFTDQNLVLPLKPLHSLGVDRVVGTGGKAIRLRDPSRWETLIADSAGNVAMARRRFEAGTIIVCTRSIVGGRPDASDAINARMWKPLLSDAVRAKAADPRRHPQKQPPENTSTRGGLRIQYSDYLAPYAETLFDLHRRGRPELESIMGVPSPRGMLTWLLLVPTDFGGYFVDTTLNIGVFSRGFPADPYGMIEMLGHEAAQSWLVPFPEPMWADALPTYVGILLGRRLGYAKRADQAVQGWIAGARGLDPTLSKIDLRPEAHPPHAVAMGKAIWIWEQLRAQQPDIVSRYARAKRRMLNPARRKIYTADDCVAVLSSAVGRDLFPWFRSIGIGVEESRTTLPLPQ